MKKTNNKSNLLSQPKKAIQGLFKLMGVAAVIYSVVLFQKIDFPEVLPVEDIEVIGELIYLDKDKIVATLKQDIKGGYFTVDLAALREMLLQQPWVRDVSLRRQWPASIKVSVIEKIPVAYWGKDAYIGQSGEVFKPRVRVNDLILPVLNGPHGRHADVWKFMNELYSEMALQEYQVIRLDLDNRRAWQFVIATEINVYADINKKQDDNNIIVKLGRFDTEKRLQRFVRMLPLLTQQRGGTLFNVSQAPEAMATRDSNMNVDVEKIIEVIDMRYPNGFAVQLSSRKINEV